MILYYRKGPKNKPVYCRKQIDEDGTVTIRESRCYIDQIVEGGLEYYLIYNTKQDLFQPAYHYLNYRLSGSPYNTRYQKALCLRLFFAFLELEPTVDIERLDLHALETFQHFLKQTPLRGKVRDNKTVNAILDNIAPLFENGNSALKWDALTDKVETMRSIHYDGNSEIHVRTIKRKNRLNTGTNRNRHLPIYITPEQFFLFLQEAKKAGDREGEIIIRLMYECGMRIGECHGLTIQDIVTEEQSGKAYYAVLIRNRPTDRKYQCAKRKPRVIDEDECKTATYEDDTDTVFIDSSLFYLIMNYLEEVHTVASVKQKKQYEEGYATCIEESDFKNHYLLLNKKGGVLKPNEWNERLRTYFKAIGLPIDTSVKKAGLNHRFRHGFAMFALKYWENPPTPLQLKRMMRHKCMSSTAIYARYSVEDEIEIKEMFIEELYKMAPGLKYEFNQPHL